MQSLNPIYIKNMYVKYRENSGINYATILIGVICG